MLEFFGLFGAGGLLDNWLNWEMKIIVAVVPALIGAVIVYLRSRKSERWVSFKDVVMIVLLVIVGFVLLVAFGFIEAD